MFEVRLTRFRSIAMLAIVSSALIAQVARNSAARHVQLEMQVSARSKAASQAKR